MLKRADHGCNAKLATSCASLALDKSWTVPGRISSLRQTDSSPAELLSGLAPSRLKDGRSYIPQVLIHQVMPILRFGVQLFGLLDLTRLASHIGFVQPACRLGFAFAGFFGVGLEVHDRYASASCTSAQLSFYTV
jgi:hypothetical protein